MRVRIFTHDPMLTLCETPEATAEVYGPDELEESGIEVPDELAKEVIETYEKMRGLSKRLAEVRSEHETKTSKAWCYGCASFQLDVRKASAVPNNTRATTKLCPACRERVQAFTSR